MSVIGTVFEAGTVRGDQCVRAVAPDRVQIAACGGFGSDAALTLAYAQIAYVFDDPRRDAVEITLAPILRH